MNSVFILEFLRISDETLFNNKKAELDLITKPSKTEEILSLKGYVS